MHSQDDLELAALSKNFFSQPEPRADHEVIVRDPQPMVGAEVSNSEVDLDSETMGERRLVRQSQARPRVLSGSPKRYRIDDDKPRTIAYA